MSLGGSIIVCMTTNTYSQNQDLDPAKLSCALWCTMDIETASRQDGSICELAVIWRDGQGSQLGECETLVRLPPEHHFDPEFSQFHGITSDMTADSPDMSQVMAELGPCLEGVKILAHNSHFEYQHFQGLQESFPRLWVPAEAQFVDTLRISRYTYWQEGRHKLVDVVSRYGIDFDCDKAHRAMYDVQVLDTWFREYASRHHGGDFAGALADYASRPADEGSYEWWKARTPPSPPSEKQVAFVQSLADQGYLSPEEVEAAPHTKPAYSDLIDQAISRRDGGRVMAS